MGRGGARAVLIGLVVRGSSSGCGSSSARTRRSWPRGTRSSGPAPSSRRQRRGSGRLIEPGPRHGHDPGRRDDAQLRERRRRVRHRGTRPKELVGTKLSTSSTPTTGPSTSLAEANVRGAGDTGARRAIRVPAANLGRATGAPSRRSARTSRATPRCAASSRRSATSASATEAEEAIRASEERFRSVAAQLFDIVPDHRSPGDRPVRQRLRHARLRHPARGVHRHECFRQRPPRRRLAPHGVAWRRA